MGKKDHTTYESSSSDNGRPQTSKRKPTTYDCYVISESNGGILQRHTYVTSSKSTARLELAGTGAKNRKRYAINITKSDTKSAAIWVQTSCLIFEMHNNFHYNVQYDCFCERTYV